MRSIVSLIGLFECMALDCCVDRGTVQYCVSRLKAEGPSFWTITLPKLSKFVLASLEKGFFDVKGFTYISRQGRSLRYFRSLLGKLFSLRTGKVLKNPCPLALKSLRQVCEYVYKLAVPSPEKHVKEGTKKFLATQKRLSQLDLCSNWVERLRKNLETYYPSFQKLHTHEILRYGPRPGPGTFADLSQQVPGQVSSFAWKLMPSSIIGLCDSILRPFSGYFAPYPGCKLSASKQSFVTVDKVSELLFVPKDSRGPRVIVREPLHVITPQMAFFDAVTSAISNDTDGRVNFTDQEVNKALARAGSLLGSLATLDLKDASDSVSFRLMTKVTRNCPGVSFFLRKVRSSSVQLPDGNRITMESVAGMGSGLTFPLMSLLIHLSICTYIADKTSADYRDISRRVYTFGDDVVVPVWMADHAKEALRKSGLLVNEEKSFSSGPFRESCGGDYLLGSDVTPVRLTLKGVGLTGFLSYPRNKEDNLIVSLIAHSRKLNENFLFRTERFWKRAIKKLFPYALPFTGDDSSILGYRGCEFDIRTQNLSHSLHRIHGQDSGSAVMEEYVFYTKTTPEIPSGELCPYKYLGSMLGRKNIVSPLTSFASYPTYYLNHSVSTLEKLYAHAERGGEFGFYTVPRTQRIIKKVCTRLNLF